MQTALIAHSTLDGFRKRTGRILPFDEGKITAAIRRAAEEVDRKYGLPEGCPEDIARVSCAAVIGRLNNGQDEFYVCPESDGRRIANIEDIQNLVEVEVAACGYEEVANAYRRFRHARMKARDRIRVCGHTSNNHPDVTDASLLLVESISDNISSPWNRQRICDQLLAIGLNAADAANIAKTVENTVISSNMTTVTTGLLRELVNNELGQRGFSEKIRDMSLYRIPRSFLDQLMFAHSHENSNITANNPEAVSTALAEVTLKQWALDNVFSAEVRRAHDTGAIHLHDLGYPHRVYCSSHSVEYIKKYGLRGLKNLNTESAPAKSASVLTGHINTFLASMQANYAGALGLAYINIFYASYLRGMDDRAMYQIAQELIFNGSQNAFSRGGQTLFLDFNIHSGVPQYLCDVPAIGPGGCYMLERNGETLPLIEKINCGEDGAGNRLMSLYVVDTDGSDRLVLQECYSKTEGVHYDALVEKELACHGEKIVTYGDFQDEAQRFALALLAVWQAGDMNGRIFQFPKCDFHVTQETFVDAGQMAVFQKACELAAANGSTYFIFDRDEVTLSACCRLRTTIDDTHMLRHPESMRFCGFQNVTINVPQAAYRAAQKGNRTLDGLWDEIAATMDIAMMAHLQKKERIAEMIKPGGPLQQIGGTACDGKPYVSLDAATYILGLIGVNDAISFIAGEEFHTSEYAHELGLRLVSRMYLRTKRYRETYNLKVTLEESPAESAARRLARMDLAYFPGEASKTVKGTKDAEYYTNSIHLAADAPVSLVERIRKQAMFHVLIESGAMVHAFVGEERPSATAIAELIQKVMNRTQAAQVTISPEFTYCLACGLNDRGLHNVCRHCGSTDVEGETRVVGYFSKVRNWNKSKQLGELVDRQKGSYSVVIAQ